MWDANVKMCNQHEGHKEDADGTNQKLISTSEMQYLAG